MNGVLRITQVDYLVQAYVLVAGQLVLLVALGDNRLDFNRRHTLR